MASLIAAGAGLLGAIIGAGATAYVNDANLDAERQAQAAELNASRDSAVRAQRRPIYVRFSSAANRWATYQQVIATCPTPEKCQYDQDDLDNARHEFQVAINNMFIYGSSEAQELVREVAATLPSPRNGIAGSAELGDVDEAHFSASIVEFENLMCMDVSLAPDDCASN